MKNEKCEKIMDTFLALDKDERLPLSVSLHLLACPHCRSQVRLSCLRAAFVCRGRGRFVGSSDFAKTFPAGVRSKPDFASPLGCFRHFDGDFDAEFCAEHGGQFFGTENCVLPCFCNDYHNVLRDVYWLQH